MAAWDYDTTRYCSGGLYVIAQRICTRYWVNVVVLWKDWTMKKIDFTGIVL